MLAPIAAPALNGYVAFVVAEPKVARPVVVFHELFFEPSDKAYQYCCEWGDGWGKPRCNWVDTDDYKTKRIKVFMTDAQLDRLAKWLEDK